MAEKTVGIQFELSETLASEILAFERESEMKDHREMFANFVALWRWAASRSKEGKAIVALDEQTKLYNELALPALIKVRFKS